MLRCLEFLVVYLPGNDLKKEEEEEEENNDNDKDSEVGTEFLIKKEEGVPLKDEEVDKCGPGKEISDIAAAAMSIQPTGYTLETAHVSYPEFLLIKLTVFMLGPSTKFIV